MQPSGGTARAFPPSNYRRETKVSWEYGLEYTRDGLSGRPSALSNPACAAALADGRWLIVDLEHEYGARIWDTRHPERPVQTVALKDVRWGCELEPDLLALAVPGGVALATGSGSVVGMLRTPLLPDPRFVSRVPTTGGIVVVDTVQRRVVEISREGLQVWELALEFKLVQPRSAVVCPLTGLMVIADDRPNWVAVLDRANGKIVWSFGRKGRGGRDTSHLFAPKYAELTASGTALIADSYNNRVIEVDNSGRILWTHGGSDRIGSRPGHLWRPTMITQTPAGRLICDSKNDRVIEIASDGTKLAQIGAASVVNASLRLPRAVSEAPNGELLVTDTHNSRVVMLGNNRFQACWPDSNDYLYWPRCAIHRDKGYLVADGLNNRLVIVEGDGEVTSTYNSFDVNGHEAQLVDPHQVFLTENGSALIANTGADSVLRVNLESGRAEDISFGFGLSDPHAAIQAADGTVLISDTGNSRIIRGEPSGGHAAILGVTWPDGSFTPFVGPRHVSQIGQDAFLVTDSDLRVIFCITASGEGIWWLGDSEAVKTSARPLYVDGRTLLYDPRWSVLCSNSQLVIADTGNNRILSLVPTDGGAWSREPSDKCRNAD
jgi:DNA-binding beta-propeller fold protein YncE